MDKKNILTVLLCIFLGFEISASQEFLQVVNIDCS